MKSPFRSIRQTLFNEGKLLRYLGYAVGEVILIIVGILFALKINDWNEDRKAQVEFVEYIVQLREDVRTALSNTTNSINAIDRRIPRMEYIEVFLDQETYTDKELEEFEFALETLPVVSIHRVRIGLLGQLLEGDMRVINRDKDLGKRALEFENEITLVFNIFGQNVHRLNEFSVRLTDHFGRARRRDGTVSDYDLEQLKSSRGFGYLVTSMITDYRTYREWYENLKQELESFLAVLEEYE